MVTKWLGWKTLEEPVIRWETWEEHPVTTEWETVAELRINKEFNDTIVRATEDANSWYSSQSPWGGPLVHPGALLQKVLELLAMFHFAVPDTPERPSLHARQESIFYRPVMVEEPFFLEARVADKFERGGRKYVVYEANVKLLDTTPVLFYRQTRMIEGALKL